MASSPNSIFVMNVEGFGDLLKIWGQRDRTCAAYIDRQLMQLMPEFNRMPPPPANLIERGVLCFAKRSDGKYYRARVTSEVCNNSVMVLFIDYGQREMVGVSNIRLRNEVTDGVISAIVPQADEFFLANVASRGGWFEEVLNEVRRDLHYKEYMYKFDLNSNQKFIYIMYQNQDYADTLFRRNLATPVQVADQVLFLKYRYGPREEGGNHYMALNPAIPQSQLMPKIQQEQLNIPVNPVNTRQTGYPNTMNQNAFNQNNNNVRNDPKVPQVLSSVMVEALADQLKQHLFKDSVKSTSDTSHNYVIQVLEVGTKHNIYVSHIDDGPWSFSIQLVSNEHELNQLMDKLATCDLHPIKPPVVLGYPCIAKSKEYDNYCRGVVVNISHSAVKIFFVDFGNTEDLPVSSIFELPVAFFKIKAMSQKFALSGLQKIKPSLEIKEAFVEVVENELLLLHVTALEGENLPTCDLYLKNVNIKRILNDKIRQIKKWAPLQPPQQGEVEDVVVTWIDSPQKFYVQLKKYDRELENLKLELAQWGANGEFLNPDELVPGAMCICCFTGDNEWYRAIVTSINSEDSVTVFYVDFGNTEEVRTNAIKKVGDGIIRQLNAQAIQCCLHGSENKSVQEHAKIVLESLILEKELRLKVIYTDKNHIVVKLFDKDNEISFSMLERTTDSKSSPTCAADDTKEETVRRNRVKTEAGPNRNDIRNRAPPTHSKLEGKSWRMKEGRSPRCEVSSEGGWRSDDGRRDGKGKDEKRGKTKWYGIHTNMKEFGGNEEKNWRNRERGTVMRKDKLIEKDSERAKPAERIMERAKRAAKETQERGMKMYDMSDTKYPVKLENMALHGAKFKKKHIPICSVEEVIVTYFLNPGEIYVQLLSTKEDFRKVMNELQNYYAMKLPIANYPKKGDVVVAKFKDDEVLYRASVINSNPLSVRYADYGNEEVTEKERLWPMDKRFLELEAQAIKCSLPNLLPNGADTWPVPEAQIDKIFEFETYSCKFLSCTDDVYEVCLTIKENGRDVRDELISIGFALPAENKTEKRDDITKCPSMDLTLMRNETYKAYISHVIDPTEFYIQLERGTLFGVEKELKKYSEAEEVRREFIHLFTEVLWRLAHKCNSHMTPKLIGNKETIIDNMNLNFCRSAPHLGSNTVSEGGLYVVNIDGENWRRVKVMTKTESGAFVQLIDYGDKLDIAYEQIRPAAKEVLEYPPQAVQCCLFKETEEYPSGVAESLKKCHKNVFIAYVHDVLGNRLRVTLYDSEGEKLDFLDSLSEAPSVIRPITSVPITKQGTVVVFSHIASPKEIYIQRLNDIPALEELRGAMLEFYTIGGEEVEKGSKVCAVKSLADECWYRARVLMSSGGKAKVLHIDYGNLEEVPLENMKKLDPMFEENYSYCRKISLNLDYNAEVERELTEKLCDIIEEVECVAYFAKVDDVLYAELIIDNGAVSDRLLSDKMKRVRNGMFREVLAARKVEEAPEKDLGVFISHVSSPSEFWVHHESISNELEEFQNLLQSACSISSPKKDVRVGDVVGALFTDQLWYRSKVVDLEGNIPVVQFIDYGNSLKIDGSDVVVLAESLAGVTPFANYCSLKGKWKDTAASRFEEIITIKQDPFTLVELEAGNPRVVDLVQNGVSVTEQLISEGYSVDNDIPEDGIYITHVNTPNDFYIQRQNDKSLFDSLINGLLEADMFEDVEDVKENEVYCAKFPENEMWYRAKVLKKSETGAYVHFIDFGNSCHVTDIKLLPLEFSNIPSLSLNCCLLYGQTNDTWSEAACMKLKEYMNHSPLRMETVLSGAHRNVVKLLTEEGEDLTEVLEKLCEKDEREFVCLTHINSPNDFYMQRVNNKNFDVIEERLKEWETFEDLEKREVGMLCCAKFEDSMWYRVELRSVGDDICDVFFIDYGNTGQAKELKSLPEDVKGIEPLAKNCSLDFRVKNVPESIKHHFIQLTENSTMLRAVVVRRGNRDVVSLILDGMKLEEVLLYSILDVDCQSVKINETKTPGDLQTGGGNLEDDVRAGNETDEEKRVKIATESENAEGFRSDDEKGKMECHALNSSGVNVPDNELLEETETGEESEEFVAEEESREVGTTSPSDKFESTTGQKYYMEPESREETAEDDTVCEEAAASSEKDASRKACHHH